MSKLAVEYYFTGSTTSGYDSTKTSLGPLMWQNSGATANDKWIGPYPIQMGRPMEASSASVAVYPHVVSQTDDIDYIFYADLSAVAVTRKITMYEYNKATQAFTYKGFVNLRFPPTSATTQLVRGFRMCYYTASEGHCQVTGSQVTMSAEAQLFTKGFATGSRIGFGSTSSENISTWYQTSQIFSNNTGVTLTTPYTASSPYSGSYIMEEYRALTLTTNATIASGGLFITKGLVPELFTALGTNIPPATSSDNNQATYWLLDETIPTLGTGSGITNPPMIDYNTDYAYALVISGATTVANIYKYNVRAPLSGLIQGKCTSSFMYKTGNQTVAGTISQANNGRFGTLAHGVASGSPSLYFVTTTRCYRVAESNITSGSTNFISDVMVETPPGGTSTFAATSVLANVEIASTIDRLILGTTNATSLRSYVTQYKTDSSQFDHILGLDIKQYNQSTADSGITAAPFNNLITPLSLYSEKGVLYVSRNGTTALLNQVYTIPLSADWQYASTTGCRIKSPAINTPNAVKFYSVYVDEIELLGSNNLGLPTEPFRVYARTSGISDDSGGWTLLSRAGDLSAFSGADEIQFMFEFRLIGITCIPTRIYSLAVIYEGLDTDSHYTPSVNESDVSNRIFAWRQSTAWGTNIPNMRIRLYNVATEGLILDDDSNTHSLGTWEYSTDGVSWVAWDNTKDVIGYYIRYTATSLPDGTTVRALLTQ